ncbi:MAG TPA: cytochrome d ubiquinol oxidase subunit II [Armatimonadota bacterium]|jgi:cytochrome d ubiquinol oxidase subunit II
MPDINTAWFIVLALMLSGYAVLDGFDLGVGALHLLVARTDDERATVINSIGPVWNGNEVWLLAAGGSMVVAFPHLYAAGFSGFYLALMLVLWLLVLRGLSIEFRHQVDHPMWREIWDVVFCGASALLGVLFGVAVGNILLGVPFSADGTFQGSFEIMLNPFAILGGVLGLCLLCLHGASYLALRTVGALQDRARKYASVLWWVVIALLVVVSAASLKARAPGMPGFLDNFRAHPALFLITALGAGSAITMFVARKANRDKQAFLSSTALIVSILGSAAAAVFPYLLLSRTPGVKGLTIYNTASSPYSMSTALGIYLVGMAIVAIYLTAVYRTWRGKVTADTAYHP